MKHEEVADDVLTGQIIGCAIKVHKQLGCGFQEVIYQRALAMELDNAKLAFERELEMPIFYNGVEIGSRRVDFLVAGEVMVELKAIREMDDLQLAQALNYLRVYQVKRGLLLNFGFTKLQIKRVVL